MDVSRWQRIRAAFEELSELKPDAQSQRLQQLEADDAEIAAEVAAMLAADRQSPDPATASLFETPQLIDAFAEREQAADAARWVGSRLGPWRLQRAIGHGGMGAVWLAQRDDGAYEGAVAIKLMRAGFDSEDLSRRFQAERQILANLDHPNIARLVDAGTDAEGRPFLALEYVDGEDIAAFCDRHKLGLEARLKLFLEVCSAVAHAHQRLVVHRDLKPGNILVTGEGRVRLLDFGIAKLIVDNVARTQTGLQCFTPEYAAPEQVRGELPTTAVDVYALGVLLYQLLSGRLPYAVAHDTAQAWQRAVLEQEPTGPSVALTRRVSSRVEISTDEIAAARSLAPMRLRQLLRGDLDAIVLKALRKDPSARYGSVRELAADVSAYLERRPVSARRGNLRYQTARWIERHLLVAALGLLTTVSLVGGLGLALWQAREAQSQRDLAQLEREQAQAEARRSTATVDFLTRVFANADPSRTDGAKVLARDLLSAGETELAEGGTLDAATRTSLGLAITRAYQGLQDATGMLRVIEPLLEDAARSGNPRLHIDALLMLSAAHSDGGEPAKALIEVERAERLLHDSGLDDRRLQADIDRRIALTLLNLERYEDALPRLRSAYAEFNALEGPLGPELISMLDLYVHYFGQTGRGADAISVTLPSYQALPTAPPMPLIRRAQLLEAHGRALTLAGQFEAAEQVLREALACVEQVYGKDQLGTTSTMAKLVSALSKQQRYRQAAALSERAAGIRRKAYGSGHSKIDTLLANTAVMYLNAGDPAKARTFTAELLTALAQRPDVKPSALAEARVIDARVQLASGDLAAAIAVRDEVAPMRAELMVSGQRHFDLLTAALEQAAMR